MKKTGWMAMAVMGVPLVAAAQSSVTLYGVLDAGVTFISNQGGSRNTVMSTGMQVPNLFGLQGSEDLGGGLKAIFKLEGQFGLENGQSIGGGAFGRQTYVGLASPWGTLTFGNQYEFMFESLSAKRLGQSLGYVSLYNLQQGPFQGLGTPYGGLDFNRVAGAFRVANAVKYETPDYRGLDAGVMYGFGGVAGSFGTDSTISAGINYANGPLGLNAAYTYAKDPTINNGRDGIRNWGFGGRYTIGKLQLDAMYTNTRNTFSNAHVDVYQAGIDYMFSPFTIVHGDYQYMKGNAKLGNNKAHQFGVTLDYWLSKRTDIYTNLVYQRASGNADANAWISGLSAPAAGGNQTAVRIGMRHLF
ncbi:porin [Burkholderia sp. IDO3]|uniref:porin n=1 Tax=Burkholderia sp. IDO3 TaxID=1705310 RepID=UPI001F07BFE8|nr:porin [Burkholderia sp. IDO3]